MTDLHTIFMEIKLNVFFIERNGEETTNLISKKMLSMWFYSKTFNQYVECPGIES
jgi:hypothetical protein